MLGEKTIVFVPYNHRALGKHLGAKWDPLIKKWYFITDQETPTKKDFEKKLKYHIEQSDKMMKEHD